MRGLDRYNPFGVCVYFLCAAGLPMFISHPVLALLSLCGAVSLYFLRFGGKAPLSHLFYLGLLLVTTLINPLFNHRGKTVLLLLNNNPITLEALLYGFVMGVTMVSVLYWFRVFSSVMTSDKLLYVLGRLSPKLSLVLSMTLRYIPLFGVQARKTNAAQKAMGLYNGDNLPDRIRGGSRVFSVMVTWALENGVITADSMTARGYGTGRRTHFALFHFDGRDAVLLAASLALCVLCAIWKADYGFYPVLSPLVSEKTDLLFIVCYGILAFLPSGIEIREALKWHCLTSGI